MLVLLVQVSTSESKKIYISEKIFIKDKSSVEL